MVMMGEKRGRTILGNLGGFGVALFGDSVCLFLSIGVFCLLVAW